MAGLNFQSPTLVTGALNTECLAGLGTPLTSPSGSIVEQYLGYLGYDFALTSADALKLSNTAVGTLYGGIYKFVQIKSTYSAAPDVGYSVVWSDRKNYIITPDVAAGTAGWFAGVSLVKAALWAGSYYMPIQVAGRATVKMKSSLTVATPADGDLIILDTTTGLCDDIGQGSGTITIDQTRRMVGVAFNGGVAPAASALVVVDLYRHNDNNW